MLSFTPCHTPSQPIPFPFYYCYIYIYYMYIYTLILSHSLAIPLGTDLSIPNPFLSRTDVRKIHCPKPKNYGLGPVYTQSCK